MVNAGDGKHEHPTQALLDLYTLKRRAGALEGLRVWTVSLKDSPFSTALPFDAKLMTSADSDLAASSKDDRVRVLAS